MNKMPFSFSLVALALLLGGCVTYQHPDPAESKEALKQDKQQAGAGGVGQCDAAVRHAHALTAQHFQQSLHQGAANAPAVEGG